MSRYLIKHLEIKAEEGWKALPIYRRNGDGEIASTYEYDYSQGALRDYFSSSLSPYGEYMERGLPKDVSDECKSYFEDLFSKENCFARSLTWVTVSELCDILEKEKSQYFEKYREAISSKYENTIQSKLDIILDILKWGDRGQKAKEEDWIEEDYREDMSYYEGDRFWEIASLSSEIDLCRDLSHIFTGEFYDDSEIRIIMYIS